MAALTDRVPFVVAMLGNRADLASSPPVAADKAVKWLADAYIDIATNYPFELLETSIPDQMVGNLDTYNLPDGCRAIRALTLLFPLGVNNEPRPIRRRHIRNIRRYQTVSQGPPSIYALLGTPLPQPITATPGVGASTQPLPVPQIIVRPVPDTGYTFIWDIRLKPKLTDDVVSTVLQVDDDWLEIIDYAAVLRGHTVLFERDKAAEVYQILFGGYDPNTGQKWPGLIKEKMTRKKADYEDEEWGMMPVIRRHTNTP